MDHSALCTGRAEEKKLNQIQEPSATEELTLGPQVAEVEVDRPTMGCHRV